MWHCLLLTLSLTPGQQPLPSTPAAGQSGLPASPGGAQGVAVQPAAGKPYLPDLPPAAAAKPSPFPGEMSQSLEEDPLDLFGVAQNTGGQPTSSTTPPVSRASLAPRPILKSQPRACACPKAPGHAAFCPVAALADGRIPGLPAHRRAAGFHHGPLMKQLQGTPTGDWLLTNGVRVYGWVTVEGNVSTSTRANTPDSYSIRPNNVDMDQAPSASTATWTRSRPTTSTLASVRPSITALITATSQRAAG